MSDNSLMRSTSVMAAGTFVSRILGFVRTSLLTGLLGVSGALAADTFITANTVPNQIYNLIASGLLNAVLVPQIVRAAKDPDGGQAFLDRLLTVSLLGIAAVTLVATLLAPAVPLVLKPSEVAPLAADSRMSPGASCSAPIVSAPAGGCRPGFCTCRCGCPEASSP